jgi:hypothetical protein
MTQNNDLVKWGKVDNPFETKFFPLSMEHHMDSQIDNVLNSYNYRCDEFKNNHTGLHILFSGCSVTYGEALLKEEVWSKKLYNKISNDKEVSGYYNLAIRGFSTYEIVINVFKYINKFGKPDFIFLNIPTDSRFYSYDSSNKYFTYANLDTDSDNKDLYHTMPLLSFHYLLMLEMYCKSNNIKLNCFSWYSGVEYGKEDIESFIKIKDDDLTELIFEYQKNNKDDKNALKARDNKHQGTAFHDAWSKIMYNKYLEDIGVS